jgi:hypothetical protein
MSGVQVPQRPPLFDVSQVVLEKHQVVCLAD